MIYQLLTSYKLHYLGRQHIPQFLFLSRIGCLDMYHGKYSRTRGSARLILEEWSGSQTTCLLPFRVSLGYSGHNVEKQACGRTTAESRPKYCTLEKSNVSSI